MRSEEYFATHPVFTHEEFLRSRSDTGSPRTADSLLRKHVERGRIVRVRRGLFASVPPGLRADRFEADPYLVAAKAAPDSVISHHAALQFHGRSYTVWSRVTFLTLRHARSFRFGATEFLPVRPPKAVAHLPDMGGGVEVVRIGGGVVRVSTSERALVDLFHSPALGGGWEEIWRSLEMVDFFDLEAVVSYALALDSAITAARVGFFLEQHRDALFVLPHHLAQLAGHAPKQSRYLDSGQEQGRLMKPWNLIVPARVLERGWEEPAQW